jgi:hypothetical protein
MEEYYKGLNGMDGMDEIYGMGWGCSDLIAHPAVALTLRGRDGTRQQHL